MKLTIKVWEITDGYSKWYSLYYRPNDFQVNIFNDGYEEVTLPEGYKLDQTEWGKPYIYKNGFAYIIDKSRTGYILYPATVTIKEAYEQKRIIYI